MGAVQRNHQPATGRDDLVPLATEFRLGHRDSFWIDSFGDRNDAADFRAHSAEAQQIGGPVV